MYLKAKKISLDEAHLKNQTTPRYDHKVQVKYVLKTKEYLINISLQTETNKQFWKVEKFQKITLIGKYNDA